MSTEINIGRPTRNRLTYDKCDVIIENLINGKKMKEISQIEGMPSVSILYSWCSRNLYLKKLIAGLKYFRNEYKKEQLLENALKRYSSKSLF